MLPNLLPAILTGCALAFARAIGEFGSVVLISGNMPFKTEVASVNIFGQIESDDPAAPRRSRSCCSASSLVMLSALDLIRRRTTPTRAHRDRRADRPVPPVSGRSRSPRPALASPPRRPLIALGYLLLLLALPVALVFYRTFEHGLAPVIEAIHEP